MGEGELTLVKSAIGKNEVGFTYCRTHKGQLVHGAVAEGGPMSVNIPVVCPVGSELEGLYHTHPGGVAYPSSTVLKSAARVGAKNICIQNDTKLECFRLRRRDSPS